MGRVVTDFLRLVVGYFSTSSLSREGSRRSREDDSTEDERR